MSLDLSRLRRSDRLIVAGAIALLVSLFRFKWYGISSTASVEGLRFSASANGWHTFTNSRWLWLLTIVVALAAVWARLQRREPRLPLAPGELVAALGGLSAVFIVYRIIDHPAGGGSETIGGVHYTATAGIKVGIWLGLAAAATITYGGYLAMQGTEPRAPAARGRGEDRSSAFSGLLGASEPLAEKSPPSDEPPSHGA